MGRSAIAGSFDDLGTTSLANPPSGVLPDQRISLSATHSQKIIHQQCSNYPRSTHSASVFAHLRGQSLPLSTVCTWRTNCTVLSVGFDAHVCVHLQKLRTVQSRPGVPVLARLMRHRHFCEHTMLTLKRK